MAQADGTAQRAPVEGKQSPCFPQGSEQHLRTVLLIAEESWRLQPSPAGCGLGSAHSPLDMSPLSG